MSKIEQQVIEQQIVEMLRTGIGEKNIAKRLGISEKRIARVIKKRQPCRGIPIDKHLDTGIEKHLWLWYATALLYSAEEVAFSFGVDVEKVKEFLAGSDWYRTHVS